MPFGSLLAALEEIRDPRRPQGQRYSLSHLLLFSVLAVLAGATSYQKIITFIAVQRDRLNTAFGACLRRAPAVNTLRRLFLALERDDLEAAFRRHARRVERDRPGDREAHHRARWQDAARQLRSPERPGSGSCAQRVCQRRRPHPGPPGGGRGARRDPGRANADHRAGGQRRAVHRRCPALPEGQLHAGRRDRQWLAGPGEAEPAHPA